MSIIDTLITDRTATDVTKLKALMAKDFAAMSTAEQEAWLLDSKGAYNASDMNRVGTALNYLRQMLVHDCGAMLNWTAKTNWVYTDIPTLTQIQQYAQQISSVRNALVVPEDTASAPEITKLTWQQANDIERILQVCDQLIKNVKAAFKYTNAAECCVGGLI